MTKNNILYIGIVLVFIFISYSCFKITKETFCDKKHCAKGCKKPKKITNKCKSKIINKNGRCFRQCPYKCPKSLDSCKYDNCCIGCGYQLVEVNCQDNSHDNITNNTSELSNVYSKPQLILHHNNQKINIGSILKAALKHDHTDGTMQGGTTQDGTMQDGTMQDGTMQGGTTQQMKGAQLIQQTQEPVGSFENQSIDPMLSSSHIKSNNTDVNVKSKNTGFTPASLDTSQPLTQQAPPLISQQPSQSPQETNTMLNQNVQGASGSNPVLSNTPV